MKDHDCDREQDLLDALASSRWPDRCDAELRDHVAGCRSCTDVLAVALPLLLESEIAHAEAHVPSSGIVWWRAQMRARREAARAASRPITLVQAVAAACGAALVAIAALWAFPAMRTWMAAARDLAGHATFQLPSLAAIEAFTPVGLIGWSILALCLVLAPIAIYFAVASDSR